MKPELLAPSGDHTCLLAAIENGADAVYFGLQRHNARARATNFDGQELGEIMARLHRHGVRGYVTLNTLVFPSELADLESTIREIVEAFVDAVIIQDLGLARLIRALTPDLEIHASTQMSITSHEGIRLAKELGCSRVILARELSLDEIEKLTKTAELPLEVFVHGALCVAYSGQCLTSEALGGRSANRGECAQACRMPYQIVCDGELQDLGATQYLLSPQDLAAYDLIPRLMELGVASLKIEGRLKTPEYVANITSHYRRAIDAAWEERQADFSRRDVQEMELSFSRGFSHGFFDGNNHKVLVRGDYGKKRGIYLGHVTSVSGDRIRLDLAAPVKCGDGLVFDADEARNIPEQGGRVYEVAQAVPTHGRSKTNEPSLKEVSDGPVFLRFGQHDLDPRKVRVGQRVWKTDDPELTRRLRKSFEGASRRKVALDIRVRAEAGQPLFIEAHAATGQSAEVVSDMPLETAQRLGADEALFREQLGRLGGSVFELGELHSEISGNPMVPKSLLNGLRRDLVEKLDASQGLAPSRSLSCEPVLSSLQSRIVELRESLLKPETPELSVLCRSTKQIEAALAAGVRTIYADYQDIKEYKDAVAAVRSGSASIYLATPRIEKPYEGNLYRFIDKQKPDGFLIRNAGGLAYCIERAIPFVVDFSMNAANELTVDLLKSKGARRVTASYDLNVEQLADLIVAVPSDWLEVVIHQQIPMFHMEHCVFCAFLSPGTDKTNCGRPCDRHDVKLRDRVGKEHPLKADVGCRNTLFNAVPQTAAESLPRLIDLGARHLRIEFLDDTPEMASRTIALYQQAIRGERDAKTLWRDLKASNRYGVTRGPLSVL